MEAVSLVVAALVAGLTAGVTEIAKTAVSDTYGAFKSLLQEKVKANDDAKDALEKVVESPDSKGRQEFLKEELMKLEIEKDKELLSLATALLEDLDPAGKSSGKYNISITDAKGVAIGDQAKVEQHFGTSK